MSKADKPVVITALPVAFTRNGELDRGGSREIFDFAASSGVEGALALGTTSEFPSLSYEERRDITESVLAAFDGLRCVVHVGAASAYEVAKLIDQAKSAGATELALLTPYYLPATDHEVVGFFEAASTVAAGTPIYAYAFRDRTGNPVSASLMRELAQIPNVIGAKVSGEALEKVAEYRAAVPESFVLYTGGDDDLGRLGDAGAQGVVSGNAAALPKPFVHLADLVARGIDGDERDEAEAVVREVVALLRGDMPRLKAALRMQGVQAGYPRMPLDEPDSAVMDQIERAVHTYGAAER